MTKRILLLGARGPATLALCRLLGKEGHAVSVFDSVHPAIAFSSKYVQKTFVGPAPCVNVVKFAEYLSEIIVQHAIDLVVPTCEEIFYFSKIKPYLPKQCRYFCDAFSKLEKLHNKYVFSQLTETFQIRAPHTILIQDADDLSKISLNNYVLKPSFSRFGEETVLHPSEKDKSRVLNTLDKKWIAQKRVDGEELCAFAISQDGRLISCVVYHPKYRYKTGAGVFFERKQCFEINQFCSEIVRELNFTGQISFDFIRSYCGEIYVLECNPRLTSGIHLFSEKARLSAAYVDSTNSSFIEPDGPNASIKLVMLLTFGKQARCVGLKKTILDFWLSKDIICETKDFFPTIYQLYCLVFMSLKALLRGESIEKTSTSDIEWNGDAIELVNYKN